MAIALTRSPSSIHNRFLHAKFLLARDLQKWEYVPLGPFLSKSFASSISPWIVTMEALRPFIVDNPHQNPSPFAHLSHSDPFSFDIDLAIAIKRNIFIFFLIVHFLSGGKPSRLCRMPNQLSGNFLFEITKDFFRLLGGSQTDKNPTLV